MHHYRNTEIQKYMITKKQKFRYTEIPTYTATQCMSLLQVAVMHHYRSCEGLNTGFSGKGSPVLKVGQTLVVCCQRLGSRLSVQVFGLLKERNKINFEKDTTMKIFLTDPV